MLLNNSRDRTRCPHSTVRDQGLLQQSYLKQDVLLEAITDNNSWIIKIKETGMIKKLQAPIALEVANHRQIKLLGLSQISTTTIAGKTGKK